MKTDKLKKINQVGHIANIVLLVAKILCIIGISVSLICSIISFILIPLSKDSDLFVINGKADGSVQVSALEFGESIISDARSDMENIDFDMFGIKIFCDTQENSDGSVTTQISANLDDVRISQSAMFAILGASLFGGAVVLGAFLVTIIFARKLAAVLETCNSPFEAEVLKRMKHFAFSLIPWGIVFGLSSNSLIMVAIVILAIFALVYIFAYGAELQQESDDTV